MYLHKQHALGLVAEDLALVFVAGELRAVVVLVHQRHIHSHQRDVVGWHRLPGFNLHIQMKTNKGTRWNHEFKKNINTGSHFIGFF